MERLTLASAGRFFPVWEITAATLQMRPEGRVAIEYHAPVNPNLVQQKAGKTQQVNPRLNSHVDQLTGTAQLMVKQIPMRCNAIRPCERIRPWQSQRHNRLRS